ncbi:MAG TPA: amidase family protein [Acidimicrobiales bacterium]|nr:amidase family protein [Acidimicrobiales bacterium]
MDFRQETLPALAAGVRTGERSAEELVGHALARIDALDDRVNAFVALDEAGARAAARAIDSAVARGERVGPLAGIPIGVKDLEDAAGLPTTRGSAVFAGQAPATADSLLVDRLRAAGCVVVGKTNTPELGWKADTDNATFGATRNPWDLERSPGGSSGGSAAAIAAGMVPLATGSDGGGSLRIPASACGLSCLKPSLGRVPSGGGHAPDWHHLSTRGLLARTTDDLVQALDIVIGPDPTDLRSLPMPENSWTAALDNAHVPFAVAWSPTLGYAPLDDEVRAVCERAVRTMEELGAKVIDVDEVFPEDPVEPWLKLTSAYNLRTLEPFVGTEVWDQVDPGLAATVDWARSLSALDMVKAEDACHLLNLRLVQLFHEVRLLVTPTVAAPTPLSGEPGIINGTSDLNWVRFTYPFNLTRSPAATVCAGFTESGMPVGLQMVGPQHGDLVVSRAAAALERGLDLNPIAPI